MGDESEDQVSGAAFLGWICFLNEDLALTALLANIDRLHGTQLNSTLSPLELNIMARK